MFTIKNINSSYGEDVEFSGDNIEECENLMLEALNYCFGEDSPTILLEGIDYEIVK